MSFVFAAVASRTRPSALRGPALAALTSLLAVACAAQNEAPVVGSAPAGAPGKAAGPAMAPEQTARIVTGAGTPASAAGSLPEAMPGAGSMPAGHPPVGAGGPAAAAAVDPHGAPNPHGAGTAVGGGTGGTLKGRITLDAAVAADVKPGSVLFIIVRKDAGEGQKGMLMASKKLEVGGANMFPLDYEIGPENVMMGGSALEGQVRVEARLDQDGDAISKQPGDLVGARAGAVAVGATGVDFAVREKLP